MEVYVLNSSLQKIALIDSYKSLIWANRYQEIGDCELYLEVTTESLQLFRKGYYLMREDSEMVCRIESIELDTDAEDGNYLIVVGYDVKKILDQRIMWNQSNFKGKAEVYCRNLIQNHLINPSLQGRKIDVVSLGTLKGYTESIDEQNSYVNIGEKVREFCTNYGWGYKMPFVNGKFAFELYKGTDRSDVVTFSPDYENIIGTKYVDDNSNLGNIGVVLGEGEGSARIRKVCGSGTGINRWEIYIDARDISKTITYDDLTALYPGGSIRTSGTLYTYRVPTLDLQIFDDSQLAELQAKYPSGTVVTVDSVRYFRIANIDVANLDSNVAEEINEVILRDVVYENLLLSRGYETLSDYGEVITFEGDIEPTMTFVYGRDYQIGDIIYIVNEFGISRDVRIIEVIEVSDENGYTLSVKFKEV